MLEKLQKHLEDNLPFLKNKKLLLAVSGGVDSMVMVELFHRLQMDICVAHCNFQLRGIESDDDEFFVSQQMLERNIPIFVTRFDTKKYSESKKMSVQVIARNLRYDWFYTLLAKHGFDYILTAHHLDDSLETFLINFTRGTGIDGLTGIPVINDKVVRPLLAFSRNDIQDFAVKNLIPWREDSSNATDKYWRNKLRLEVVPLLKTLNPSFLQSFENTIKNLQEAKSVLDDAVKIVYDNVVTEDEHHTVIDLNLLSRYENHKAYLYKWLQPYGFSDWTAIRELIKAQSGKQIFSETHVLLKNRRLLLLFPKIQPANEEIFYIDKNLKQVNFPLKLEFCNLSDISNDETNTIFVDEEKLKYPLCIRKWIEGDFFYPSGMKGKKKLSKYFKDEKLSLLEKSNTWILCSDNQIVWVIGKRQDERFKTEKNTTKILKINYFN